MDTDEAIWIGIAAAANTVLWRMIMAVGTYSVGIQPSTAIMGELSLFIFAAGVLSLCGASGGGRRNTAHDAERSRDLGREANL